MNLEKEVQELKTLLGVEKAEIKNKEIYFSFRFSFCHDNQNFKELNCSGEVRLVVPKKYPQENIIAYEIGETIQKNYPHMYPDHSLCLESPLNIKKINLENPSIIYFVENLIYPFYYSYFFYKKYKTYPFGELPHGAKGLIQSYFKIFQVDSINSIIQALKELKLGFRGHHFCYCSSGKRLRNCHGNCIKPLPKLSVQDINYNIYIIEKDIQQKIYNLGLMK